MSALFVEAVDTAITLGWTLAEWIIVVAAVVTVAGWLFIATVAGTYTATRDALSGALSAERALRALPGAQAAIQARTGPSWAHTEQDAA